MEGKPASTGDAAPRPAIPATRRARRALAAIVPAFVALASLAALPFWILGIPGTPDALYSGPWRAGLMALGIYPTAYALLFVVLIGTRMFGRPLSVQIHRLIWLLLASFVAAMALVVVRLASL